MSFYIKPERNGAIYPADIPYRAGKAYPILRGDRFTKTDDDILQEGMVLINNICYHVTNCEQGFKVYQGQEITDPVLKDWGAVVTKSNNSLFRDHSRLDAELCDWIYDIVIGQGFVAMSGGTVRDRFDCLNPFRSTKFVGKISLTKSYEDRIRERETAMKVGKAIRMIFPELSDANLGIVVDKYNLQFGSKDYTLHHTSDPDVISSVYKEENHAPMGNPKTTAMRKSLAHSCMRYAFDDQSHHPAYVYGSGDFVLYYTKDGQGRTGSRCLVYDTEKTPRPQAGPIYGVCEHSMDKIKDELDRIDAERKHPDWVGARLLHIPYDGGVIGPYIDYEPRTLSIESKDYLVIDNYGDIDASQYNGILHEGGCSCDDCGCHVDEDYIRSYGDEMYCEDCFYERYDYCNWTDDYYPHDELVQVYPSEEYVWRDHDQVIYIEATDEFWDSEHCVYSEPEDVWIPIDQMHDLGYFECEWTNEIHRDNKWAETTDGEIVCVPALEEKGWVRTEDGYWCDPKEKEEGDK